MSDQIVRLALIGCGAVTERAHLPVCAREPGVSVTALVDPNVARAKQLAKAYGVPNVLPDASPLHEFADAAILAVPHALHCRIGAGLLRRGVHILVEKPMALTAEECDAMTAAAGEGRAVLAVGLMRRFAPWARLVKEVLDLGLLGSVRSFYVREGLKYSWPVASDFFFKKSAAGGGVLIDTGAHALDSVLWWFGEPVSFEYFDDAEGGVEADCEVGLVMPSGARGRVELSRTRDLGCRVSIRGDRASLEVEPYSRDARFTVSGLQIDGIVRNLNGPADDGEYLRLMASSMSDWLGAIRHGRSPCVSGAEGRRSVAFIEQCYLHRQRLVYPWLSQTNPGVRELTEVAL
jgi:predicted dehydrogenase